ncbi:MAG: hypothetical protein CGW95_14620 [Phenylobacterium zucineum]|nr:MAG: hypothetical protein CGW95_14620 [Phenylobacterium zucineum]
MRLKQCLFVYLGIALLSAVAGCGPTRDAGQRQTAKSVAEADYKTPPQVTSVRMIAGQFEVFGTASPLAAVRLARPTAPAGQGLADKSGHWVIRLPRATQTEIYGVSETISGRQLQASGYLLVTQDGLGVILRAGTGAVVLSPSNPARIAALDIDREGGAVVSGFGPPGIRISARVDGTKLGEARVDPQGRFVLPLTGPVNLGSHVLRVFGDGIDSALTMEATQVLPLQTSPYRATAIGPALRVDWMTPGGGEQTTWVYGQDGGGS